MAYEYKPDHLKKRAGRPRKYENTIRPTKHMPKGMTKQEVAELLRGVPVVQLDYATGEYIGEYPSLTSAEIDNDLRDTSLISAFYRNGRHCCMGYIHKEEMLFMKKVDFEKMMNSVKGVLNEA